MFFNLAKTALIIFAYTFNSCTSRLCWAGISGQAAGDYIVRCCPLSDVLWYLEQQISPRERRSGCLHKVIFINSTVEIALTPFPITPSLMTRPSVESQKALQSNHTVKRAMLRCLVRGGTGILPYAEDPDSRSALALEICLGKRWPSGAVLGCAFAPTGAWDQTAARQSRQYPRGGRRAFASEASSSCNSPAHNRYIDTSSPVSCICRIGGVKFGLP